MAASANETLRDEEIAHQIDLQAYSNAVVRRIIGLLNRTDVDLLRQLGEALERLPASAFTVERLEQLLFSVRQLNLQAYQQVERELTDELRELARYEAGYQLGLFQSVLPPAVATRVGLAAVDIEQVYTAAFSRPFQGRLLREWSQTIEADRLTRIRDAVRIGYVEGQTTQQIIQRVRGTRAKGYSDGIIEIDRRNAEAVVRTAVSHVAGAARDRFYEQNEDLIKAVVWSATLDTRTSEGCRIRDGKRYEPVSHKPLGHKIPWAGGPGRLHWRCRSSSYPVTKSWRELGLDIDDLPPPARASMDGTVPGDTTFGDWLKRQSAARQDEIVGATRGKLMRQGDMPFDSLYTNRGQLLTLEELRKKNAEAFRRAGLD